MSGQQYGFEWDEVNTAKVAAHDLTVGEVESVFDDELRVTVPGQRARAMTYGTTHTSKFVCVIWFRSAETAVRVTTAYRVNPKRIKP